MARIESRNFKSKKFLLVILESKEESEMVDRMLGQPFTTRVSGEVKLADGYGEHYISLVGSKQASSEGE